MRQGQRPNAAPCPQQRAPKAFWLDNLLEARLPSDYPDVTIPTGLPEQSFPFLKSSQLPCQFSYLEIKYSFAWHSLRSPQCSLNSQHIVVDLSGALTQDFPPVLKQTHQCSYSGASILLWGGGSICYSSTCCSPAPPGFPRNETFPTKVYSCGDSRGFQIHLDSAPRPS